LSTISWHAGTSVTAAVPDAAVRVVEALRHHVGASRAVLHACNVLASLSSVQEARAAVFAAHGIPALLSAMGAHIDDGDVVESALEAVALMAKHGASSVEIGASGGIDAVVACITRHAGSEGVVGAAHAALAALAEHTAHAAAVAAAVASLPPELRPAA